MSIMERRWTPRRPVLDDPRYGALIETLKKARKEAGLSQAQLAERLGITQSDVSRMENTGRIVDALEVTDWVRAVTGNDRDKFLEKMGELYDHTR